MKGRTVTLTASVSGPDGRPAAAAIGWRSEPEGVLELSGAVDGQVKITAKRDWFDDRTGREPKARLSACSGGGCTTLEVVCLPDLSGTWKAAMKFNAIPHAEDRSLVFVQDGRTITFDPEPDKPADSRRIATLALEGNRIRMVKPGSVLVVFDGLINDRSLGNGNWASSWGFSGTWTARRAP